MSTYTGVTKCQKNSPVFLAHPVLAIFKWMATMDRKDYKTSIDYVLRQVFEDFAQCNSLV